MRSLPAGLLIVVLGLVRLARAEPSEQSQARFAEGQAAYKLGNYLEAAAKFEAAYALDRDSAYLFNIAQAYRLGRDCAKAVEYFQRFRAEVPTLPESEQAQLRHYLHESEICAADQGRERDQRSGVAAAGAKRRRAKLVGATIMAVGGALGLGAGVYFTKRASDLEDEREALCPPVEGCIWAEQKAKVEDVDSSGRTANIMMVTSYSIGGAAIIGGLMYFVFGGRSDELAVTPVAGGAVVSGRLEF